MPRTVDHREIGPKPELDEEAVRSWIAANPDFFDRNLDLLTDRAEDVPGVVDLRQRLLEKLRQTLERRRIREREILLAAEDRARVVSRTHDAVLLTLRQTSLSAIAQRIASQFPVLFSVTAAVLIVEGAAEESQTNPAELPGDAMDALLAPGEIVRLGRATEIDREMLGERFSSVQSLAVLRLGTRRDHMLLVLGSSSPREFSPDLATDLLDFLGSVLALAIDKWPSRRR